LLDRQPGEKTEALARRMVQEVLSTLGGSKTEPPALRVMNGVDEGKRFEIREELAEVTLGRSPECDMPLNDQNISRRHCLIKRNWHGFTAQDLGSKNGVIVNGNKIEGAYNLKDGDEIQIGGVKLIFIDPPSRLLDQMGALNGETVDGRSAPHAAASDGENGEAEAEADEGEAAPEREARSDPAPEMDIEPVGTGRSMPQFDDPPEPPDPELLKVNAEIQQVTRKGLGWEFLILVLGAVFLVGALALIVFLFL
jgi:pSer/pThr/pTyr-binding forkhead associated (FHA) protein